MITITNDDLERQLEALSRECGEPAERIVERAIEEKLWWARVCGCQAKGDTKQ